MTDAWKWPATLVDGPFDGRTVEVEGCPDVLQLPVPPGPPKLADYGPPSLAPSGPVVATYVLVEQEYLDVTGEVAFQRGVPDLPLVGGKYRWRPSTDEIDAVVAASLSRRVLPTDFSSTLEAAPLDYEAIRRLFMGE